ncbi:HepT-like ribonuclease domain-containing protein [Aquisalimonas sp.]|uniref:HepT-like ribonuclease domain-containing protein n=1 Tax=Aquisalimonas sp. TaxID=1872621 RepID=UPI0025B7D558|nr:HepT-like ribonuclease domain-containing protein [Aquisalimonas sp.]
MRRDPKKYLYDVSVAADRVQRFLAGKSFPDYDVDELLRAGVERQFEIMGEALNQLSQVAPEIAAKIPEYRRIVAFRNILIHAYADVDNAIVWGIASGKLPKLRRAVAHLLDDSDELD